VTCLVICMYSSILSSWPILG